MPAVALALSFLLGAPVTGALTAVQIAALAGLAAQAAPGAFALARRVHIETRTPRFRAWVAANGEAAIRLRPGISTQR